MLSLVWLVACGGRPPDGFDALIQVQGDEVRVNGSDVASWADRSQLGQPGSPLVTALQGRLPAGRPGAVAVDVPDGTFGDLQTLVDASGNAGFSTMGFRIPGTPLIAGNVQIPPTTPLVPSGDVTGADVIAAVGVRTDGSSSWIEASATFAPHHGAPAPATFPGPPSTEGLPVDCAVVYKDNASAQAACTDGMTSSSPSHVTLGGAIGCFVTPVADVTAASSWKTEVNSDLLSLDARKDHAWEIVPDTTAPVGLIVPIVTGFTTAGVQAPFLVDAVPPGNTLVPTDCSGTVRDARSLDVAAARWLGAAARPPGLAPAPGAPPVDPPAPGAPAAPPAGGASAAPPL